MMYEEAGSRALEVLSRALGSASRVTRLRAIAMLEHVDCRNRMSWLETACADSDDDVVATAHAVLSWVAEVAEPPWPQREDPRFDRRAESPAEVAPWGRSEDSRWQWEYVVEIWREDGLLVGTYLATTCSEDDEHARRIALGQAILANAGDTGDVFDASAAAAFVVGKRHLPDRPAAPGRRNRDSGTG